MSDPTPPPPPPVPTRVAYAPGQLLTDQDFTAEQAYNQEKLQLHNRYLHTWGIGSGLIVGLTAPPLTTQSLEAEAAQRIAGGKKRTRPSAASTQTAATTDEAAAPAWTYTLSPGCAVDAQGREIYFDGSDGTLPPLPGDDGDYYLTAAYGEAPPPQTPTRVQEIPIMAFTPLPTSDSFDPSMTLILSKLTVSGGAYSQDESERTYSSLPMIGSLLANQQNLLNRIAALEKAVAALKKK